MVKPEMQDAPDYSALVEPIAVDTLPKVGRGGSDLTDADKALANAIAATAVNGNYANIVGVIATKADAEKRAAVIKRLVKRAGVVPEGKAARTRIVVVDGGFRVAAGFGDPGVAPKKKGDAAAPAADAAPAATS
jgi:hypothetical protein